MIDVFRCYYEGEKAKDNSKELLTKVYLLVSYNIYIRSSQKAIQIHERQK